MFCHNLDRCQLAHLVSIYTLIDCLFSLFYYLIFRVKLENRVIVVHPEIEEKKETKANQDLKEILDYLVLKVNADSLVILASKAHLVCLELLEIEVIM